MTAIYISYLNLPDIEALQITDDEILGALVGLGQRLRFF